MAEALGHNPCADVDLSNDLHPARKEREESEAATTDATVALTTPVAPFKLVEGITAFMGMPVPWSQYWHTVQTPQGKKKVPDYTTVDQEKVIKALEKRLCGICGQTLGKYIYFLGGIRGSIFKDPPMHEKCAEFSVLACPYLGGKRERPASRTDPDDAGGPGIMPTVVRTKAVGYQIVNKELARPQGVIERVVVRQNTGEYNARNG